MAWWDEHAPLDQTDLTSDQDGSSQALRKLLKGGANLSHRGPAGARVGLAGPTCRLLAPPSRRVSSRVFLNPLVSSFRRE